MPKTPNEDELIQKTLREVQEKDPRVNLMVDVSAEDEDWLHRRRKREEEIS